MLTTLKNVTDWDIETVRRLSEADTDYPDEVQDISRRLAAQQQKVTDLRQRLEDTDWSEGSSSVSPSSSEAESEDSFPQDSSDVFPTEFDSSDHYSDD